jgi:tRNA pseudouridine38-40 synthase
MPSWRLTLEYEGTRYSGWQEQKHARTVAGEIRAAAERVFKDRVDLAGAGRTDAGVHALGQVARLVARKRTGDEQLRIALNDELPADINVLTVEKCDPRFDPRRDAVQRHYLYQISTRRTAFAKRYVWWVKDHLNTSLMQQAASSLAGRRDFSRFSEGSGDEKSTLVVVEQAEIAAEEDLILFRIVASHFLWKMVRRLAGSLVEVGRENITVGDFAGLLAPGAGSSTSRGYAVAAHTAPPSGLFLEKVTYDSRGRAGPLAAAFPVRSA